MVTADEPKDPLGAVRVLVVDDDPLVRNVLRRGLAAFEVVAVADARDALAQLVAGEEFAAIVSDLAMPNMSGMRFYEEVTRLAPKHLSRIIFLTGGTDVPALRDFLADVPNAVLFKPFEIQSLRDLVSSKITASARGRALPAWDGLPPRGP